MKQMNRSGLGRPKFKVTTNSKHKKSIAPNILARKFIADAPNQVWTSDITYIPTKEGWLYLCIILDVFSRAIVGWSMKNTLAADIVTESLKAAVLTRKINQGLLFHSDRGSQYASDLVRKFLAQHGMDQSMSGAGNCYDNAITESFFATLKKELIHRCQFQTRQQAATAVFEYIEVMYNRKKGHSALGFKSPYEFEAAS